VSLKLFFTFLNFNNMISPISRLNVKEVPNECKSLDDLSAKLALLGSGQTFALMIYEAPNPDAQGKITHPTIPYLVFAPVLPHHQPISQNSVLDIVNAVSFSLLPCPPHCNDRPNFAVVV
jgi:hypothetical protein